MIQYVNKCHVYAFCTIVTYTQLQMKIFEEHDETKLQSHTITTHIYGIDDNGVCQIKKTNGKLNLLSWQLVPYNMCQEGPLFGSIRYGFGGFLLVLRIYPIKKLKILIQQKNYFDLTLVEIGDKYSITNDTWQIFSEMTCSSVVKVNRRRWFDRLSKK